MAREIALLNPSLKPFYNNCPLDTLMWSFQSIHDECDNCGQEASLIYGSLQDHPLSPHTLQSPGWKCIRIPLSVTKECLKCYQNI